MIYTRPLLRYLLPINLGILFSTMLPVNVWADSDGYYCLGKGYIAYEFRVTPKFIPHELNIIYYGGNEGISSPVKVMIDEFQTHGMKCGESSIEILSWDSIYTIDITDRYKPRMVNKKSLEKPGIYVKGFINKNLGEWSREKLVSLETDDLDHLYQLHMSRQSESKEGTIYVRHTTEMVQINDKTEKETQRFKIFESVVPVDPPCGS